MTMRIRFVLLLLAFACIAVFLLNRLSNPETRGLCPRCNVVVIMIDSLRADKLPCYGYRLDTAPGICAFASENIRFSNAYANSSWTLPSSMSFFTSLYPSHHGIGVTLQNALSNRVTTFPGYLKDYGYETIFVSTPQPNVGLRQGLSEAFTSVRETDPTLTKAFPVWIQAIDDIREANDARHTPVFAYFHTDDVWSYADDFMRRHDAFPLDPSYAFTDLPAVRFDEKLRKKALEILLDEAALRISSNVSDQYKTWYLSLRDAPTVREAERVFRNLPERIRLASVSHLVAPGLSDTRRQEFFELKRHVYDEHIRTTDQIVSKVLDRLKDDGLLENTIVVITGEHGELLGEKGLLGHAEELHDREIHVPLVVHVPETAARVIPDLTQLIDVAPTVLELLGLPQKPTSDGISLAWRVRGRPIGPANRYAVSEWTNSDSVSAILSDRWKLHIEADGLNDKLLLYDRANDAEELHDVSRAVPRTVAAMARAYAAIIRRHPSYPVEHRPFPSWIDEEQRNNLIESGYFGTP